MGFNIGLYSDQIDDEENCDCFVDTSFYFFVNSKEIYGEQSILSQSASYYDIDLSPLLRLVYISEADKDYIQYNKQQVSFLFHLLTTFYDRIHADSSICNHVKYSWYYPPAIASFDTVSKLYEQICWQVGKPQSLTENDLIQLKTDDLNPWKWYFEKGKILEDINNLLQTLKCYQNKGITEVCLTAM